MYLWGNWPLSWEGKRNKLGPAANSLIPDKEQVF
jgi:hypothetical protein